MPAHQNNIFVVDDEKIVRVTLTDDLTDAGYSVSAFADPLDVVEALKQTQPGLILSDIKMPNISGLELLSRVKALRPEVPVIMMTAHGSVETAVEAMKNGAHDYVTKPFNIEELLLVIKRTLDHVGVKRENTRLRRELARGKTLSDYIGTSEAVENVRRLIRTAASSDATILIIGETGTGKELVADILHCESQRFGKPYVKVSCAVLSSEVFESELFGHIRGAFTGADKDRVGRFRNANTGTIFLDDIDDIPLAMQVKLLRVLEDRSLEPVGSSTSVPLDVRVLASTKADLESLVEEGKFRQDLFYRLNVFPLTLPPLRSRSEDIPVLVRHFCDLIAPNRKIEIPENTMVRLCSHSWPGNVRELRNVVERLLLLSSGCSLDIQSADTIPNHSVVLNPEVFVKEKGLDNAVADVERSLIEQALALHGGNQKKSAEYLQIPPSTLRSKIAKYNSR